MGKKEGRKSEKPVELKRGRGERELLGCVWVD